MKIKDLIDNNGKGIVFNKSLLEKPCSQYVQIGGLSEKIFVDYCQRNGLQVIGMGEFSYRLLLYGRHVKQLKHERVIERNNFRKLKVEHFISMFSKEQLKFLEEDCMDVEYGLNDKKTGLPDFFVWDGSNRFAFIEIKAGTSLLSKKQRDVLKKLITLFPVYVCHIAFDVTLRDLEIENINFGFVSVNKEFKFDMGGLVERSLYHEAHIN